MDIAGRGQRSDTTERAGGSNNRVDQRSLVTDIGPKDLRLYMAGGVGVVDGGEMIPDGVDGGVAAVGGRDGGGDAAGGEAVLMLKLNAGFGVEDFAGFEAGGGVEDDAGVEVGGGGVRRGGADAATTTAKSSSGTSVCGLHGRADHFDEAEVHCCDEEV